MINRILLFFILILASTYIYSQDYLINFAGSGSSATVDMVKVENLTQGTSLNINGTDVLNLKSVVTGINFVYENSYKSLRIYPNPATEYSTIEFLATATGNVLITIRNNAGKIILQTNANLVKGIHTYQLKGLGNGIYIAQVTSEKYSYTGKIISQLKGEAITSISHMNFLDVSNTENRLKSTNTNIQMQYTAGDRLKLTGISGNYSTVFIDIPNQNKTITFDFIACTDRNNSNYPIVKIGTQVWMAENLKTTKYSDGTDIGTTTPATLDLTGLSTPKYQWAYSGNETNVTTYGRLYTWYAITDSKGVCPTGWHVPTDGEWTTLTNYLINNGYGYQGSGSDIGKSMSAVSGWVTYTLAGTIGNNQKSNNSSGFTALPCGYRNYDGIFYLAGSNSYWWSATEDITLYAWNRYLNYSSSDIYSYSRKSNIGYAVRCLKD